MLRCHSHLQLDPAVPDSDGQDSVASGRARPLMHNCGTLHLGSAVGYLSRSAAPAPEYKEHDSEVLSTIAGRTKSKRSVERKDYLSMILRQRRHQILAAGVLGPPNGAILFLPTIHNYRSSYFTPSSSERCLPRRILDNFHPPLLGTRMYLVLNCTGWVTSWVYAIYLDAFAATCEEHNGLVAHEDEASLDLNAVS